MTNARSKFPLLLRSGVLALASAGAFFILLVGVGLYKAQQLHIQRIVDAQTKHEKLLEERERQQRLKFPRGLREAL